MHFLVVANKSLLSQRTQSVLLVNRLPDAGGITCNIGSILSKDGLDISVKKIKVYHEAYEKDFSSAVK